MPTFGHGEGAETFYYQDKMRGCIGTPAGAGKATKITCYCAAFSDSYYGNAKCALYKSSDGSLVGSTDEVYIDWLEKGLHDWVFSIPLDIEPIEYIIVIWMDKYVHLNYDAITDEGRQKDNVRCIQAGHGQGHCSN